MLYAHLQTAPDEAFAQELFALRSPQALLYRWHQVFLNIEIKKYRTEGHACDG